MLCLSPDWGNIKTKTKLSQSKFTEEGLTRLAAIVRQARGPLSYTGFQEVTGISHAALWKIENLKVKRVEFETLDALAPHTGYTKEQLLAIATEVDAAPIPPKNPSKCDSVEFLYAAEAIPHLKKLLPGEAFLLIEDLMQSSALSSDELAKLLLRLSDAIAAKLNNQSGEVSASTRVRVKREMNPEPRVDFIADV